MESFIPVYQREAILATTGQYVGSQHAKTCVILALRRDNKVVLAHIDAGSINAVRDMTAKLPDYNEVHVACPKVRACDYNVWEHVQQSLNRDIDWKVGHESSLAICPETGDVVRDWGDEVKEKTSDKKRRRLQMILTLEKETPLRWFTLDGEILKPEWTLPASVFTFKTFE